MDGSIRAAFTRQCEEVIGCGKNRVLATNCVAPYYELRTNGFWTNAPLYARFLDIRDSKEEIS